MQYIVLIIIIELLNSNNRKHFCIGISQWWSYICDSMCTCPRGLMICHHMAAVSLFAHHNCSSTDTICSWNVRNSNLENTKTISDLFLLVHIKLQFVYLTKTKSNFKKALEQLGTPIGMSWLLKPEPDVEVQFQQSSVFINYNDIIVSD